MKLPPSGLPARRPPRPPKRIRKNVRPRGRRCSLQSFDTLQLTRCSLPALSASSDDIHRRQAVHQLHYNRCENSGLWALKQGLAGRLKIFSGLLLKRVSNWTLHYEWYQGEWYIKQCISLKWTCRGIEVSHRFPTLGTWDWGMEPVNFNTFYACARHLTVGILLMNFS